MLSVSLNPKSITISDFLGKGHMGWQTTDHLLVNRGFESHMGYLGGSESYKWGRMDQSLDPNPLTVSRHDIAAIWVAFFSRWQRYRC